MRQPFARIHRWVRRAAHSRVLAFLILIAAAVGGAALEAHRAPPRAPGAPAHAVIAWVVQLVIAIVAAVISYALAPKPPKPRPAALDEFDLPVAEEGRVICVVFGEVVIPDPSVAWYGDLSSKPVKMKGGK